MTFGVEANHAIQNSQRLQPDFLPDRIVCEDSPTERFNEFHAYIARFVKIANFFGEFFSL